MRTKESLASSTFPTLRIVGSKEGSATGDAPLVTGEPPAAAHPRPDVPPPLAPVPFFRRASLDASLARARDAEALRVAPPLVRALFWLCSAIVLTAIFLAFVLDVEQTGFARGMLRVEGGGPTVGVEAPGTVVEVAAHSGDVVAAGALLVRVDSAQTRSALVDAERQIALTRSTLEEFRHRRESNHAERLRLLTRTGVLLAARAAKQDESSRRLRTKQSAVARMEHEGVASNFEKSDIDDQLAGSEREVIRLREEHAKVKLQAASIATDLAQEEAALLDAVRRTAARRDVLLVQLAQTEVRAPVPGRVESLVSKPGDVLGPGVPVCRIVPTTAPREVIVLLPERQRAFLKEGALTRVELDQLPSGEFGTFSARVVRIGAAIASAAEAEEAGTRSNEPVFRVELRLEPSENLARHESLLRSGSLVTARFALRKRRVITLVLEPLRRYFR